MSSLNKLRTWQLLTGLLMVILGSTVFIVAVSGGFGGLSRAEVSGEYRCKGECNDGYMDLTPEKYDELVTEKKSFVVFVDQEGCKTADNLGRFVMDFAKAKGIKIFKMMFEDVKTTSLHDLVKYYPSVAVVSNGKVVGFLRADADEDSDAYNKYEAFEAWANWYLK